MNHSTSILKKVGITAVICALVIAAPSIIHAAGILTATQTVANVTKVNDQTDTTVTTQANVVQVKAARTVLVNSIPVASTTSTIGSCVVTYSTNTPDSLNCSGNAAIVNVTTHNTAAALAATLQTLSGVSDATNGHGALTITVASTTADTFTTTGTEASSSAIFFSDGTSGAVTAASSTVGVVPKAQVNTLTVGGTPEVGDIFAVTIPTGVISYTTVASDTSLANIALDLDTAIVASSTYSSQAFTVATSSVSNIVFTAKTAGTGFVQTATTTNATSTAQVVTFTPSAIIGTEEYSITINSTTYNYIDTTGSLVDVVSGITSALSSVPGVTCVNSTTYVTCTANVAGTPFTYSATSSFVTNQNSGGSGGGTTGGGSGGSGGSIHYTVPTVPAVTTPATTTTTVLGKSSFAGLASSITKTLHYGSENSSVKKLQTLLASDPTLSFTGTISGYFGLKTRAAVEAFQNKYSVVTAGASGYGTVGPKTRKELVTVFGS